MSHICEEVDMYGFAGMEPRKYFDHETVQVAPQLQEVMPPALDAAAIGLSRPSPSLTAMHPHPRTCTCIKSPSPSG